MQEGEISAGSVDTVRLEKSGRRCQKQDLCKERGQLTFKREVVGEDNADDKRGHKQKELTMVVHADYRRQIRQYDRRRYGNVHILQFQTHGQ